MNSFPTEVRKLFDPIAAVFALVCEAETETKVKYANSRMFLEICFDSHRSYEVSVNVGRVPESIDSSFDLVDVLRRYRYHDLHRVGELRGRNDHELVASLEELATLTQKFATTLLSGDQSEIIAVRTFRYWASLQYAWETKKSQSVVVAYRKLVASPQFDEVKKSLDDTGNRVLREAQLLAEQSQ